MVAMSSALRAMLDTPTLVAPIVVTTPADGEIEEGKTVGTARAVMMRIEAIGGRLRHLPEGKQMDATELAFADSDAALEEGEYVTATSGPYSGMVWEIIHPDPVHGDHYEVVLARRPNAPAAMTPSA